MRQSAAITPANGETVSPPIPHGETCCAALALRRGDNHAEARARQIIAASFKRHGATLPADDQPCGSLFHYCETHADLYEQMGVDLSEFDWADTVGALIALVLATMSEAGHA